VGNNSNILCLSVERSKDERMAKNLVC
jgi:hypothetical protein